ncbi:MAG: hypothetical protein AAF387_07850 [Pseudomonadota bacterium]
MRTDTNTRYYNGLCGILLLALLISPLIQAAPAVNISGFWQLDETRSDDPAPQLKDVGKFNQKKKRSSETQQRAGDKPIGGDTYRRYW